MAELHKKYEHLYLDSSVLCQTESLSSLKFYIAIPCYCVCAFILVVPTVVCVLNICVYSVAEI